MDQKKIILIILTCLTLLYADFQFVIKAQLGGIKSAKSKSTQLKKQVDKLSQELASLQELKRKEEQSKREMLARAKKFIFAGQLTPLLEDISLTANKRKVKFTQMKPVRQQVKKDDKTLLTAKLTPMTINIDLSCGYHELGAFINDLENKEEFLKVENLRITADAKDGSSQKVSLVLKTYVK